MTTKLIIRLSTNGTVVGYGSHNDTATELGAALLQAQADASSGDTILVFAPVIISSPIGKHGVNFWFSPVLVTASGTSSVISDSGSAMTFTVMGSARFVTTNAEGIKLTAASTVDVACLSLTNAGASKAAIYVDHNSAVLNIVADTLTSTNYDAIWYRRGTVNFDIRKITAGDNAFEGGAGIGYTPVIKGRVHEIVSTNCAFHIAQGTFEIAYDTLTQSSSGDNVAIIGNGTQTADGIIVGPYLPGSATVDVGSACTFRRMTIDCRTVGDGLVTLASDGSIFDNCTILANSGQTHSIETYGNPVTVTIIGPLYANKPKDSDVTLTQLGTVNGL